MAVANLQKPLFSVERAVNVASVRHLSPFRYPGGKTWFVPYLKLWLSGVRRPRHFLEPFAGGGSVSCAVLSENLADRVTMVELDARVAEVWSVVFSTCAEELAERILAFDLTLENVQAVLAVPCGNAVDGAFQTILRNRVNRGGILAPGAGLIKAGENGRGLRSRWYPETLARRVRTLEALRDRVSVVCGDGIGFLEQHGGETGTAAFIDPPYTAGGKKAGSRLYAHHQLEHEHLFGVAAQLSGPFVMTYDNAPEIERLAGEHGLETRAISMKNTHHALMTELLIGRDLGWVG